MDKLDIFNKSQIKQNVPKLRPGDILRIRQKVKEGDKERPQVFEGILIAKKHGCGPNATITVRKESFGVMVERIFPLHSPAVETIEVVSRAKRTRRAKLYYLRRTGGKKSQIKQRELEEHEAPKEPVKKKSEEKKEAEEEKREEMDGKSEKKKK